MTSLVINVLRLFEIELLLLKFLLVRLLFHYRACGIVSYGNTVYNDLALAILYSATEACKLAIASWLGGIVTDCAV